MWVALSPFYMRRKKDYEFRNCCGVVQPKSRGNNIIGHDWWDEKAMVILSCWWQSSCLLLLEVCLDLFLVLALLKAELRYWLGFARLYVWTCSLEVKNWNSVTRHLWDAVHIFWRTLDKWLIFLSNFLRELHWSLLCELSKLSVM